MIILSNLSLVINSIKKVCHKLLKCLLIFAIAFEQAYFPLLLMNHQSVCTGESSVGDEQQLMCLSAQSTAYLTPELS